MVFVSQRFVVQNCDVLKKAIPSIRLFFEKFTSIPFSMQHSIRIRVPYARTWKKFYHSEIQICPRVWLVDLIKMTEPSLRPPTTLNSLLPLYEHFSPHPELLSRYARQTLFSLLYRSFIIFHFAQT